MAETVASQDRPDSAPSKADAELERQRRAARLLGDLEPSVTRDETAEGWNDEGGTSRDQEILRDVPPHHGS